MQPSADVNRPISAPDVLIVKLRFRRRIEERVINRRRDLEITIDGAVDEFDFEGVELLAITDCRQRVGMDRLTRNSGSDLALFCRPCGAER